MRAAKVDANQKDIVATFEAMGATVELLHRVGRGCPDLLVGYRGLNLLVEVKDGDKPPSARKLNDKQKDWHRDWRGQVCVIDTPQAAMALLGVIPVVGRIT